MIESSGASTSPNEHLPPPQMDEEIMNLMKEVDDEEYAMFMNDLLINMEEIQEEEEEEEKDSEELMRREEGLMHRLDLKDANEKDLEDILANEMNKMSFEEREGAAFDVHGLPSVKSSLSTTELEDQKLQELDQQLQRLNCIADNSYTRSRAFRLMFLRCDEYDTKVAAQRIRAHLILKRDLFGEESLDRPISESDLNAEELSIFQRRQIKVLANRDCSGRIVAVAAPDNGAAPLGGVAFGGKHQRIQFYAMTFMASFEDIQSNGMVFVMFPTGRNAPTSVRQLKERLTKGWQCFIRLREALPRKIACSHMCLDTSKLDWASTRILPLVPQLLCRRDIRMRFRVHRGDKEMLKLKLQSYGVTVTDEDWPRAKQADMEEEEGSNVTSSDTEDDNSSTAAAIAPTEVDVLFGRGKRSQNHPGNIKADQLVDLYRSQYEKAAKSDKTAIAQRIVEMISAYSGRFLKLEKNKWVEVDSQTARNKISHLFRNKRKAK